MTASDSPSLFPRSSGPNALRLITLLGAFCALCVQADRAYAESDAAFTRIIMVEQPAETHRVRLAPGGAVTVAIESPLIEVMHHTNWPVTVKPAYTAITLRAEPIPLGDIAGLVVIVAQHFTLHVVIDPPGTTDDTRPDSTVVVKHGCTMPALRSAPPATTKVKVIATDLVDQEIVARATLGENDQADAKPREKSAADPGDATVTRREAGQQARNAVVRAVHLGHSSRPVGLGDCETGRVFLCGLRWGTIGEDGVLRFLVDNHSTRPLAISRVSAFDEYGLMDRARAVFIDGKAVPGPGDPTAVDPAAENRPGHDGVLAIIPPGARVEGSILVSDPDSVGRLLQVVVEGPSRVMHAAQWIDLQRPLPPEREKALGIGGVLGASWLHDRRGGEREEITDTRGAGIWLLYALSESWHLELDAMGATSGEVRFDNVTIDGAQGVLTRSAKLGRVQGSAFLRLAEEGLMPFVRLGIGVQGTTYRDSFSAGDAPDSTFEIDGAYNIGAGAQVRITEQVIAGAAVAYTAELGGATRHLQGGLHIGYTWQPPEE